jgi:hypothetical protein
MLSVGFDPMGAKPCPVMLSQKWRALRVRSPEIFATCSGAQLNDGSYPNFLLLNGGIWGSTRCSGSYTNGHGSISGERPSPQRAEMASFRSSKNRFALARVRIMATALWRGHRLVMTTSRYSLGTTIVASPDALKRSTSSMISLERALLPFSPSASNALSTGP